MLLSRTSIERKIALLYSAPVSLSFDDLHLPFSCDLHPCYPLTGPHGHREARKEELTYTWVAVAAQTGPPSVAFAGLARAQAVLGRSPALVPRVARVALVAILFRKVTKLVLTRQAALHATLNPVFQIRVESFKPILLLRPLRHQLENKRQRPAKLLRVRKRGRPRRRAVVKAEAVVAVEQERDAAPPFKLARRVFLTL